MGRSFRHRSSSGGSYTEMKPTNIKMDDSAAQELFELLLHVKHSSNGKSFLHSLETPQAVNMAHALLQRAAVLQDSSILQRLLQQPDQESGYSPLHWALREGHFAAVLMLLRQTCSRFQRRPMELLGEKEYTDNEHLTPLALLGMMQRNSLQACRDELLQHQQKSISTRHGSIDIEDDDEHEQDEFALLRGNLDLLEQVELNDDPQQSIHDERTTACEVLTFGRSHHVALGVPCATSDNNATTHRPQRVAEFGLDAMRDINATAVCVAAATHHSLIVTSNGALYSCGLGKGGRLGTGHELECPLFTQVKISKRRQVVHAAAAENHSLCVTDDGRVYAFGSNRFGQLGVSEQGQCFSPRKVEDLRNVCVVQVAAGDRHSMALTANGQVYTWGDNQAGQLGARQTSSTGKVQLVESLWHSSPRKVAIQICASEHSSLILVKPTVRGLPVNAVYQWGHGNHVPIKVNFSSISERRHVNPVDIACAKYHNAAVTQDGLVYTWGLHAEPLGNVSQKNSMVIASPQLVEGMLPENGGGIAVAVSAAEHHTAVVTDCGHLYTWGATFGKNVLGHEGVRWQPSPKKVVGIHRAVAVTAAKEHNVVLMGTNFPRMPPTVSSLETLAARQVAKHVDLFNVIPILITAERVECTFLKEYCNEFVRLNLDGVLCLGRKSEMDCFLNEQLASGFDKMDRDTECHPLVYDVIMAGSTSSVKAFDSAVWMEACKSLIERLPVSTLVKYRVSASNGRGSIVSRRSLRRSRTLSIHDDDDGEQKPGECSERCLMLTTAMDVKTSDAAQSKVDSLCKEVRSVRKLLNQIAKLQLADSLTPEQEQKVRRKSLLETDLARYEPALMNVEAKLRELRLEEEVEEISSPSMSVVMEEETLKEFGTPEIAPSAADADVLKDFDSPENDSAAEKKVKVFRCDLCSISCSDANNLALHKNGRKHRNRVKQVEEEEQKKVAASILEEKRRQMLSDKQRPEAPKNTEKKKSPWDKKPMQTVQPRYRLPPPPHFPSLGEAAKAPPLAKASKPTWTNSSVRPATKAAPKPSGLDFSIQGKGMKSVKAPPPSSGSNFLSPGNIPVLASPPWASPVAQVPVASSPAGFSAPMPTSTTTKEDGKKTYSLGDFMYSSSPPVTKVTASTVVAPWSSSPLAQAPATKTTNQQKSLMDIQQEEEEIRNKQPGTRVEGKWYINERVRAGSISAIQQAEKKSREHELLVEEQKLIEQQIQRERQEEEKKKKKSQAKQRRSRKQKKKNAATTSEEDAGGGNKATQSHKGSSGGGRKRRPNKRKKSNAGGAPASNAKATTTS